MSSKKKNCQNAGCQKEATMQCPKCLSLKLEPSYFCSQECFKQAWPKHKDVHVQSEQSKVDVQKALFESNDKDSDGLPEHFKGFHFSGPLRPGKISPMRKVPDNIPKPEYAVTGDPLSERTSRNNSTIPINTPEQIEIMRNTCRIGREILDIAGKAVRPGITTDEIDRIVHEATIERGAYPSPLNYKGFPKSCCTSVNEIVCHGIPDSRPLQDGDIVNIDISAYHGGMHTDLNETFLVGNVDEAGQKLVNVTRECLEKAIAIVRPGTLYREVGNVISKHVHANGFSVVRSYCGHGVGELFHGAPSIPHYAKNKAVGVMKAGHIFTIEPMINEGSWHDMLWPDDWTSATRDGKRSAQFEHTILVTETGCEVLTARRS